ncbi:MAG: DUF3047 domain-containing protein [Nannocystaceae bacterium]
MRWLRLYFYSSVALVVVWALAYSGGEALATNAGVEVSFPVAAMPIDAWMKRNGWESFRGNPRRFRVEDGHLRMVSRDDSVSIQTERGFPVDPHRYAHVTMKFQVKTLPRGTQLAKKRGDDAALRLYVAFDRGGFAGLMPPNTIAYTWTESLPVGSIVQSEHFDRLRYVSVGRGGPVGGGDAAGMWMTVKRNLLADYRRVFPEDAGRVPDVLGMVLKCDSNNTHTTAEAWVAAIRIE